MSFCLGLLGLSKWFLEALEYVGDIDLEFNIDFSTYFCDEVPGTFNSIEFIAVL
jgi:hypothetical protein